MKYDGERDMGCYYPLKKMVSKAFGSCNGDHDHHHHQYLDERRQHSRGLVYSQPPTYSHTRTIAKTVTFSNENPVILIPPEPQSGATVPEYHPQPDKHYPQPANEPQEPAPRPKPEHPTETKPVKKPKPVHREPMTQNHGPVHGYVPSPLPRWEYGTQRREYFGGEYSSYPTPIREGIYNIATDPGRITSMFSEENPNACTIV